MSSHSFLGSTIVVGVSVASDISHIVYNEAPGLG